MLAASGPGAAPELAAGGRAIAVVVDFGTGQGLPASFSLCVHEPAGATDAQALADALAARGLSSPTYSSAGLLCSIAGFPAGGCGTRAPGGYSYWAYFHGGSRWTYATDGPAERGADPGVPEGWRFEPNGHGNPSDAPPGASSTPSSVCPSTTPPSTAAPTGVVTTTSAPRSVGQPTATTTTPSSTTSTSSPTAALAPPRPTTPASAHLAQGAPAGTTTSSPSSSTSVGTLLAAGILVVLLGAGAVLLRRRRS